MSKPLAEIVYHLESIKRILNEARDETAYEDYEASEIAILYGKISEFDEEFHYLLDNINESAG